MSIKSRSWPLQTTKNQNQKYLGQKVNQRPFFRIPSKQQGASFKLISNHSCCYKPNRVTNQFFGDVRGGSSLAIHMLPLFQGSYRFLDPKVKTFSRLFSKIRISFSRFKVVKKVIIRDLKKCGNKAFFMVRGKHMGEIG